MNKIIKIKFYPSNLYVVIDNEDEGTNVDIIDYDGQQGVFTRDEWYDSRELELYSHEDKERILDALENTCNVDFFAPDGEDEVEE